MTESIRYLENAKELLRNSRVEDGTYVDIKPVREAFGTAYLAVLEAINGALLQKGFAKKELPKSVEGYRKALDRYFGVRNGKLLREYEKLYDALHIAGYYRGLIYDVNMVKEAFKMARGFIEKISP